LPFLMIRRSKKTIQQDYLYVVKDMGLFLWIDYLTQ